MAAMTTALTEFADNGNSRTYTYTGHTAIKPRLVIQRRKIAASSNAVMEDTFQVIAATVDAAGVILTSKVLFEAKVRRPADGIAADVTAALAVFRDIVAGDEFTNVVNTQGWLK